MALKDGTFVAVGKTVMDEEDDAVDDGNDSVACVVEFDASTAELVSVNAGGEAGDVVETVACGVVVIVSRVMGTSVTDPTRML